VTGAAVASLTQLLRLASPSRGSLYCPCSSHRGHSETLSRNQVGCAFLGTLCPRLVWRLVGSSGSWCMLGFEHTPEVPSSILAHATTTWGLVGSQGLWRVFDLEHAPQFPGSK